VVAALRTVPGPQSAADLHRTVTDVPLSSLYRSLTVLDDAGVVRRHHDSDGLARYELAEWLGGHHHHMVCVRCGLVEDIQLDADEERALRSVIASLAERSGYQVHDHELELEGECRSCRA